MEADFLKVLRTVPFVRGQSAVISLFETADYMSTDILIQSRSASTEE